MSNFATDSDVLEYEPRIKDFGVIDFSQEHTKTTADIQRYLRINWWARVRGTSGNTRSYFAYEGLEMDTTKLNAEQFKRSAVFHVLAYYILPKLTQHQDDKFSAMIDFYKSRYLEEINDVLADGVEYDFDNDGTVENSEKQPVHFNRLVR
jgi:hypothetical protein